MDFASLMKSQIATTKQDTNDNSGKKYLKRAETEALRRADYQRQLDELESARAEAAEKKRKREDEEAEKNRAREEKKRRIAEESKRIREEEELVEENKRRKRLGLAELPKTDGQTEDAPLSDGEIDIPEEELLLKLQELQEPRLLFGETHLQRLRRYRKLTKELLAPKYSSGPIPTTIELVPEAEMRVKEMVPSDASERKYLLRQLASYFDMVLSEWQIALARRPAEVKESASGKLAFNSFAAARDNLRPLFKKLEKDDLQATILTAIVEIVYLAQSKRYVNANDAYLRLAIGKAAWPIGVTMVGIHERSAREKLHETEKGGSQAHIMSDEITRKLLQGIKRCLKFAQTRWPPDDLGQLMG